MSIIECSRRIVEHPTTTDDDVAPQLWINTPNCGWALAASGAGDWRLLPVDWEAEALPEDVVVQYGGACADRWLYAAYSPPLVAAVYGAHPSDWVVGATMPHLGGQCGAPRGPAASDGAAADACAVNRQAAVASRCNVVVEGAFVAAGRVGLQRQRSGKGPHNAAGVPAALGDGGGRTMAVAMWLQCTRDDGAPAYLPIGPTHGLPTAIPLWPWGGCGGRGACAALFSTSGTLWHVSPLGTQGRHEAPSTGTADAPWSAVVVEHHLAPPDGQHFGNRNSSHPHRLQEGRRGGGNDRRLAASSSEDAAHLDGTRVCTLDGVGQPPSTDAVQLRDQQHPPPHRAKEGSPSYGDREPFADVGMQTCGGGTSKPLLQKEGLEAINGTVDPSHPPAVPFYFSDSSAPSSPANAEDCPSLEKQRDGNRRGTCAPHEPFQTASSNVPRTELRRPLRTLRAPSSSQGSSTDASEGHVVVDSDDEDRTFNEGLDNRVIGNAACILQGVNLPTRKDALLALQQGCSSAGISTEFPSATSPTWEERAVELGSEGSVAVLSSIFNDVEPLRGGTGSLPSSRSNRAMALDASGRLAPPLSLSASLSNGGSRPLSITRRGLSAAISEPSSSLPFQQPPIGSGGAPVFLVLATTQQQRQAHRNAHHPQRRTIKINRACPWVVGVHVYGVTLQVCEHGLTPTPQSIAVANMNMTPAQRAQLQVAGKEGATTTAGAVVDHGGDDSSPTRNGVQQHIGPRELSLPRPTTADSTRCGPYLSYEMASSTNRSIAELEYFLRTDPRIRKYVTAGGVGGSFGHAPVATPSSPSSGPSSLPTATPLEATHHTADGGASGAVHLFSLADQQLRSFQMSEVLLKFLVEAPTLRLPRWLLETLQPPPHHHRDGAKTSPLPRSRRALGAVGG